MEKVKVYLRFTSHAEEDLQRGYSYHPSDARDAKEAVEMHGGEESDYEEMPNQVGQIGMKLEGLCGYEIEKEDWESGDWKDYHYDAGSVSEDHWAIYEGVDVGVSGSADLFKPLRIIQMKDRGKKKQMISFYLEEGRWELLRTIAYEKRISRAEIIRRAIKAYLEKIN